MSATTPSAEDREGIPAEPASPSPDGDAPPLLPARMLNEFAYCPRLFYLEWVQGEWAESADTLDGTHVHRRVDHPSRDGLMPPDGEDEAPRQHARSVDLSDAELGLIARIDLVEAQGDHATPVDYKRGKRPDVPGGAYEPERVQLCAQGLLLRRHGFRSERGVIYYAASRDRVEVEFSDVLMMRTLELRDAARQQAAAVHAPPPLVDSPKCPRCSLVGICLPDEHNMIEGRNDAAVRPLQPPRQDALPFHVQEHGVVVGKDGDELVARRKGEVLQRARLIDVSRVNLHGSAHVTLPALRELLHRGIAVALFSHGGWYYGRVEGHVHKNVQLRLAQYRAATDPQQALALARRLVTAKIKNARVLLRRNNRDVSKTVLAELKWAVRRADEAPDLPRLLGVEGMAARLYFEHFSGMLRRDAGGAFTLDGRNRRPPRDPLNAVLSFLYALLTSEWTATLSAIGFDPYLGFLHQPRYGRPALALDMMEEFRPIVADSVAISAINTGVLQASDFQRTSTAVALKPDGRRRLIQAYERRMDELVTHPVFGYRISYRRVFDVQARLLGRHIQREIGAFPAFVTR
jgi:CRISPR-associated protein Cas1